MRTTPAELAARYRAEGLWTDDTLGGLLATGLRDSPTTPVRIWSEARPFEGTYADLLALSLRLAGGLHRLGVQPGDRVAFQLPNWVEAAAAFYGLGLLGAVLVPVPAYYGTHDLGNVLRASGATVFITAARFGRREYLAELDDLRKDLDALRTIVVVDPPSGYKCQPFDALVDGAPLEAPATVDPDSLAMVAFTSGTSAQPKGVMHSHRSLCAETRLHLTAMVPPNRTPQVVGSPVTHAAGMVLGLLLPAYRGEPLHLTDVWDPHRLLRIAEVHRIAPGGGAAVFLSSILDHPEFTGAHAALMEYLVVGGSTVPTVLAERAQAHGIDILRAYGLTEQPTVSSGVVTDPAELRVRTDGRPLLGVEIRLVHPEGGAMVGLGSEGEIHTRGPDLFAGYTDPALTETMVDADGWFSTGDLGVLDEQGFLTITGRTKDLIIRHGINISPSEVEDILLRHPDIEDVAVVGRPDPVTGERAVAFVRPTANRTAPTIDGLRSFLGATKLAKPKWPEEVRVVSDDFPRTASGKVQKYVLRAGLNHNVRSDK